MQIHAAASADDGGIWLTWTAVVDEHFVIRAARLGCDGDFAVPPFTVVADGDDHLDSAVASRDGRALVAWARQTTDPDDNLDVYTALFDDEGVELRAPQDLAAERIAGPRDGADWMVDVAAGPDGYHLVGAWGIPEAPAFQVFHQALDADGEAIGPADEPSIAVDRSQTVPSVAVSEQGVVSLAFTSADFGDFVESYLIEDVVGDAAIQTLTEGQAPRVAYGDTGLWATWFRVTGDASEVVVRTPGGREVTLGTPGKLDYQPVVVAVPEGALVLWYRLNGGYDNALEATWLDDEGSEIAHETLRDGGVPPYALAPARLADGGVLLVWQEGNNPEFLVRSRLLRAP